MVGYKDDFPQVIDRSKLLSARLDDQRVGSTELNNIFLRRIGTQDMRLILESKNTGCERGTVYGWVFDTPHGTVITANEAYVPRRQQGNRVMRNAFVETARSGISIVSGPGHSKGSRITYSELARGAFMDIAVLIARMPMGGGAPEVVSVYDPEKDVVYTETEKDERWDRMPRLMITHKSSGFYHQCVRGE